MKILGYYQLLGGALGLGLVGWLVAHLQALTGPTLLVIILATGLYLHSIYCGRLLLVLDHETGLVQSTINQALQVVQFSLMGYSYKYGAGLGIMLGIDWTTDFNVLFNFSLSSFEFVINGREEAIQLEVNVIAVLLISYLHRLRRMIDERPALSMSEAGKGQEGYSV
ncbi:hypothetical protein GCM10027048_38220 [Hymenobacter coalescens]